MTTIEYRNPDHAKSFQKIKSLGKQLNLKKLLDPERVEKYSITAGAGLQYFFAAKSVDETRIDLLSDLAREQQLIEKYRTLAEGAVMNTSENRMVLHHLVRGQLGGTVRHDGRDLGEFYREQQERIAAFAHRVHSGNLTGSTGKRFDTVVQIGIGGSDLGPRALYLALENLMRVEGRLHMRARFISNVDPDDASDVLSGIDPETTLFILVSKSGTTQETLTNGEFVLRRMQDAGIPDPSRHMIAVTSETSPLADSKAYLDSFYIDDFIGGRYSATSAVGGAVLTLAFGAETFAGILAGAHEADRAALEEDPRRNAALMDALIGVYERNVLGFPVTAILPYSQALSRFPAHLQQLDMESNGKRVNRRGKPVDYATGPVVLGEPGTNGQHSFYQLLHQGTDIIPLQFIGFRKSQSGSDLSIEGSTSQDKLNANLAAQIVAFANGQENETDRNREFPGNRPSSLIVGDRLTPQALGALLAHYENKVMFQGFLWNINSFDQEGVQLGKVLTKQVLGKGEKDPILSAYASRLGIG